MKSGIRIPDDAGGDDRTVGIVALPDARIERAGRAPDVEVAVIAHVLPSVKQVLLPVDPDEYLRY
jgi:hypothetical protein